MNKFAVVTWASGNEFCHSSGFKVYLNTLKNINNTDYFVLTCEMPQEIRENLINRNIKVIDVDPNDVWLIIRDRNLAYSNWLSKNNNYEAYLFTDCKDVLFQRDPFEWYNNQSHKIILSSEGFDHADSLWNLNDQFKAQIDCRNFKRPMESRTVINGGVIMGDSLCLKYHFLMLWFFNLKTIMPSTDQASLNYLYNWLENWDEYYHTNPTQDNFCLTGEGVKENLVKVNFYNNLYCNKNEPYYIVHQWDRLPESERIIKEYA